MPYLSKAESSRCGDRSASVTQITYTRLALSVDVRDFAIWPFTTTVHVRVGVDLGTWGRSQWWFAWAGKLDLMGLGNLPKV